MKLLRGELARRRLSQSAFLLGAACIIPGLAAAILHSVTPQVSPDRGPVWPRVADSAFQQLVVRDPAAEGHYREAHGKVFAGANPHHACLSVQDWVLALNSARQTTLDERCRITGGLWNAALTGRWMDNPKHITAEPVVPLGVATESGLNAAALDLWQAPSREDAWLWMPMLQRTARVRAGRGIAEWRPGSRKSACHYARRWLAAKHHFRLTVTPAEKVTLAEILSRCSR